MDTMFPISPIAKVTGITVISIILMNHIIIYVPPATLESSFPISCLSGGMIDELLLFICFLGRCDFVRNAPRSVAFSLTKFW